MRSLIPIGPIVALFEPELTYISTTLNERCKEDVINIPEDYRRTVHFIIENSHAKEMHSCDEEYQYIFHDLRNIHIECRTCGRKGHIYDTCDILINHILTTNFVQKNPEIKDIVRKGFKTFVCILDPTRQQFPREHSRDKIKLTKYRKTMVHNIASDLDVMVFEPSENTTKKETHEDQSELINDPTPYGNINRATYSLKHHTEYDSSSFSPIYIDIKQITQFIHFYKHDLVNTIDDIRLADPFQ